MSSFLKNNFIMLISIVNKTTANHIIVVLEHQGTESEALDEHRPPDYGHNPLIAPHLSRTPFSCVTAGQREST